MIEIWVRLLDPEVVTMFRKKEMKQKELGEQEQKEWNLSIAK